MQKSFLPDLPDHSNGRAFHGSPADRFAHPQVNRNFPPDMEPGRSVIMEWFHVIRRQRWLLLGCALAGLAIAALLSSFTAPKYRATNYLELQALNQEFMNLKALLPSAMAGSFSTETNVQTQVHIIDSPLNILRTTVRLRAEEQGRVSRPRNLIESWMASLNLYTPKPVPTRDLVSKSIGSLKVKSVGPTRLIEIQADSTDPELAALAANDAADEYMKTVEEGRMRLNQETAKWLTQQIADLRNNLQQSEDRLQQFASSSQLLYLGNSPNNTSVAEDKLKEMQDELSKAQADRMAKQSTYELSVSAAPDALPPVLDNGPLRDYQVKLADLNRQMAELSSELTPEHPKVVKIKDQIASLEQTSRHERDNIVARIRNEFETARRRENLLSKNFKDQEATVASQDASTTHYSLLKSEVDTNRAVYEATMQKAKDANIAAAFQTNSIAVVSPAFVPEAPFSPSWPANLAVGLFLGLAFGLATAFMRNQADRRIHSPGEVGLHLGLPELGAIPAAGRAIAIAQLNGNVAALNGHTNGDAHGEIKKLTRAEEEMPFLSESFRATLLSILFTFQSENGKKSQQLLVTSAEAGDGKTTTVAYLGAAMAEVRKRVLVVDADLRRPRLHDSFGISNDRGLSNILGGEGPIDKEYVEEFITPSGKPGLDLMPSGSQRSSIAALLSSDRLDDLLKVLRRTYDIVIFDTPPLMQSADARVLGSLIDGVILVIRAGRTTVDSAVTARTRLAEDGTRIVGTILNHWNPREIGSYYKQYGRY